MHQSCFGQFSSWQEPEGNTIGWDLLKQQSSRTIQLYSDLMKQLTCANGVTIMSSPWLEERKSGENVKGTLNIRFNERMDRGRGMRVISDVLVFGNNFFPPLNVTYMCNSGFRFQQWKRRDSVQNVPLCMLDSLMRDIFWHRAKTSQQGCSQTNKLSLHLHQHLLHNYSFTTAFLLSYSLSLLFHNELTFTGQKNRTLHLYGGGAEQFC